MQKAVEHLSNITIQGNWATPTNLFIKACEKFQLSPTLDVSADKINTKCKSFFTKEENGLKQNWNEDFYMNAPYELQYDFMAKAYQESKYWNVNGLILAYSKTDTKWWHNFVEDKAEIHFIKGRIKFILPDGKISKNSAPYPSCWIIYRKR